MIQGTLNHAGLTFDATLKAGKSSLAGEDPADWSIEPIRDGFFIAHGKAAHESAGRARIYPFCVKMKGTVDVTGQGPIAGWSLGFIQSILTSTRVAKYAGGPPIAVRQNPVFLPVIDRDASTEYFYVEPIDLTVGRNTVKMTDEPNFEFKLTKKGHTLTEVLEDTQFLTFLAARNTQTSDVLVLGGYRWRACYRAIFRNGRFTTWLTNEADFERLYSQVVHHIVLAGGAVRIGDDSIAAEDNLQAFENDTWESVDDED